MLKFKHAGATAGRSIRPGAFISRPPGIRGESENMNFSKKELEILSDCIISRLEKMAECKKAFSGFENAEKEMEESMKVLQEINNKICKELD